MTISVATLELAAVVYFATVGLLIGVPVWLHMNLKGSLTKLWDEKRGVEHCNDLHKPIKNRVEKLEGSMERRRD